MRDVKLSKWLQVSGRTAGYLILFAALQVVVLPHLGSASPTAGNGYMLPLSGHSVYVNVWEFVLLLASVGGAFALGLIFLAAYFSAYFKTPPR